MWSVIAEAAVDIGAGGTGAIIGIVVAGISQMLYNIYSKKKSAEIEASEHAYSMLKRIIDDQQKKIVELENKIDKLKTDHEKEVEEAEQASDKKTKALEEEIRKLKDDYKRFKSNGSG